MDNNIKDGSLGPHIEDSAIEEESSEFHTPERRYLYKLEGFE